MPTTSPIQGVPVPQGSDADNVPYDLGQAINFLEKRLVMVFADAAARDATIAAPTEGMVAYLQATDEFTGRIGSAWVRLLSRLDLAGSGTATTVAKSDHTHDASGYSVNYAASAGNADTVDGYHASAFAGAGHGHDLSAYATWGHGHGYMEAGGAYTMTNAYPFTLPNLTLGSAYNVTLSSGLVMQRSSSSARYKKEIEDLATPVADLWRLRPVQYRYDNSVDVVESDERLMGGFIAEEVAEVFPTGAIHGEDGQVEDFDTRSVLAAAFALIHDLNARLEAAGL